MILGKLLLCCHNLIICNIGLHNEDYYIYTCVFISTVSIMWEVLNTWQLLLLLEVYYLQYKSYIKIGTSGDSCLTKAIVSFNISINI